MTDMYLRLGVYIPVEDWEREKFGLLYEENPEEARKMLVKVFKSSIKSGTATINEIGAKGFPASFIFPEEKLGLN